MRFDQVKIAAEDPERLARFYVDALDCTLVRELTEVDEVAARGIGAPGHRCVLTMVTPPGPFDPPPKIEFYGFLDGWPTGWRHLPGTAQVAFHVEDVDAAVSRCLANGAAMQGEVVDWKTPSGAVARFVYLNDPEGNIVDLWTPRLA